MVVAVCVATLFVAVFWLGAINIGLHSIRVNRGFLRWLGVFGGLCMGFGVTGAMVALLSIAGLFDWVGPNFEWPAGFSGGAVTAPNGIHIVPMAGSGRVQLYDEHWKFLHGFTVKTGGGMIRVGTLPDNQFEVATTRTHDHKVFRLDGTAISEGHYTGAFDSMGQDGEAVFVRTTPWLLPFSHGVAGGLTAIFGVFLAMVSGAIPANRKPGGGKGSEISQRNS